MGYSKFLFFIVMVLLLANIASAATIYGTVYDLSLKKVGNARVEISTVPKQVLIAQNGTYSFNVPNGKYSITAQLAQKNIVIASVQDNITITHPGNYVLDLILFPNLEEGVEDIGIDISGVIEEPGNMDDILIAGFIVLFVSGIVIGAIYFRKTRDGKPAAVKEDLEHIVKIIKNEGGRATQKDIRKEIPLSEAKISLMIAELEHKGIVQKIKKGRGNIIILRRK